MTHKNWPVRETLKFSYNLEKCERCSWSGSNSEDASFKGPHISPELSLASYPVFL